jgi:hypothetical protein
MQANTRQAREMKRAMAGLTKRKQIEANNECLAGKVLNWNQDG